MKKLIILICFMFVVMIDVVFAYNSFLITNNSILKGIQEIKFDNPIYLIDDLTYVPLRELTENLGIPVMWNNEKRQVILDINNKEVLYDKNSKANENLVNGVIPDEETAKNVAKSILEACTGRQVVYQDGDYEFYLSASFSEKQNCWFVVQYAKYKGEHFGGGNVSPIIQLNKSTGEVMSINLDFAWDKMIEFHQHKITGTK